MHAYQRILSLHNGITQGSETNVHGVRTCVRFTLGASRVASLLTSNRTDVKDAHSVVLNWTSTCRVVTFLHLCLFHTGCVTRCASAQVNGRCVRR